MPTIGEALRSGKNAIIQNANNRKFTLLGDPCNRPAIPKYSIKTVAINGQPPGSIDTLKALSEVTIQAAEVRDENDALLSNLSELRFQACMIRSLISPRAQMILTPMFLPINHSKIYFLKVNRL